MKKPSTKSKKSVTMKPLASVITEDSVELYSEKKSKQHNVPKAVKDFNRVTPKEAFGVKAKKRDREEPKKRK